MTEKDFFLLIQNEMASLLRQPAESITDKTEFPKDNRHFLMGLSLSLME